MKKGSQCPEGFELFALENSRTRAQGPFRAAKYLGYSVNREDVWQDKGEDFDNDEFDPSDYEGLDAMSSWEDIKSHFGDSDWSEIDEDLQESFITEKNKITEMFNRFNRYN